MKQKCKIYFFILLGGILLYSCNMNSSDEPALPDATEISDSTEIPQKRMFISPDGSGVTLSCDQASDTGTFSYQWYKSAKGDKKNGTKINDATGKTYTTPSLKKGIHYYYCEITNSASNATPETVLFSVAYTGLPTVRITTPNNAQITSKETWLKNADFSISSAENEAWNLENISTSIRGRGNSTWGQPKKPYAIKFDKKQSVMGMKKHKRWVLIANYLDNSFMRNSMAFYLSEQLGMDWIVHGKFVDLILNGTYQGMYWLGEAIKVDENRININDGNDTLSDDEDKDYLIEMDVYFDEPVRFKSSIRNMPYMIKNDDYMIDSNNALTTGGTARLERLETKITALEKLLYPNYTDGMNTTDCFSPNESYTTRLDVVSWAKFWLVNEIMDNGELGHPKSCYFTFDSANNILKAGPVWDFDWASLRKQESCRLTKTIYYNALFKSPAFVQAVKSVLNDYSGKIGISAKIEELRDEIKIAAQYDSMLWGVNHNPAGMTRADFDDHVDFLEETLEKKFAVVKKFVEGSGT